MPSSSTKEGLKPKPYADQDKQDQLNHYKKRASMLESDNKRIQKINKQLQRKNIKMDEEAKKMEQEIQYLKKIHTKLDSLKQLEEKHTEAMHAKEEKITRLQSSYDDQAEQMREIRSQYNEKMMALAQQEEKHNKAMEANEEEMKRVRRIVNDMNQLCTETISKFRDENENKIQITTTKIAQMKYNVKAIMREIVRQTEQIKSLDIVNEEAKWKDATNALQTAFSQKDNEVKHLMSTQKVDSIYQDINSKNLKRMRKENEEYKERIKEMDEEAKEMEQSIDDLTTLNTKLQHQINVKQSESQKQSDLMKQLEEKHTAATRVKEEEIVSMRNAHANEKAKLNDANTALQGERDELQSLCDEKMDEIQAMEQKQEEREEKHNKDAHTKEEEITRLTDALQTAFSQKDHEVERLSTESAEMKFRLTSTQKVDNIYQNINSKNLKRMRKENEEYKERIKEMEEKNEQMQSKWTQLRREIEALKEEKTKESESQRIETDKQLNAGELAQKEEEMRQKEEEIRRLTDKMNQIQTRLIEDTKRLTQMIETKQSEKAKLKDANTALQGEKGELQSLYDAMVDELAQKDDAIQAMEHNQQQKQEEIKRLTDQINQLEKKLTEAMHMKAEMRRVAGAMNDVNALCTQTMTQYRNENEQIQNTSTKIKQMEHNVNAVKREIARQTEAKENELRQANDVLHQNKDERMEELAQKDAQIESLTAEVNEKQTIIETKQSEYDEAKTALQRELSEKDRDMKRLRAEMQRKLTELAQKDRRIQLNDRVKVIQQNNPDRGHMIGFVCRLLIILVMIIAITPILLQSRTFYCYMDQLFDRFGVVANYKTVSECLSK